VVRAYTTYGETGESNEAIWEPGLDLPLEVGRVAAGHNWKWVTFRDPFADPMLSGGSM
jgi:hypothetical protein